MKNCLTIAGSGIQADLKTFSALGCYGMSVITSVFAENTHALLSSMSVSQEVIADQLEAVFSDIRVDAVKIGVLPDTGAMRAVAAALFKYKPEIVVCDPVIAATAGGELMNSSALGAFINGIIPLCSLPYRERHRHEGGGAQPVCARRGSSAHQGRTPHRRRYGRAVRRKGVQHFHA